jgi:hypothetical protein
MNGPKVSVQMVTPPVATPATNSNGGFPKLVARLMERLRTKVWLPILAEILKPYFKEQTDLKHEMNHAHSLAMSETKEQIINDLQSKMVDAFVEAKHCQVFDARKHFEKSLCNDMVLFIVAIFPNLHTLMLETVESFGQDGMEAIQSLEFLTELCVGPSEDPFNANWKAVSETPLYKCVIHGAEYLTDVHVKTLGCPQWKYLTVNTNPGKKLPLTNEGYTAISNMTSLTGITVSGNEVPWSDHHLAMLCMGLPHLRRIKIVGWPHLTTEGYTRVFELLKKMDSFKFEGCFQSQWKQVATVAQKSSLKRQAPSDEHQAPSAKRQALSTKQQTSSSQQQIALLGSQT